METKSKAKSGNNWRRQVARSRGNEWMISSYNAWQQSSPLGNLPKRNTSSILRIISKLAPAEQQFENVVNLSLKVMALLSGLLMSGKIR